jgi:hypothetical protein
MILHYYANRLCQTHTLVMTGVKVLWFAGLGQLLGWEHMVHAAQQRASRLATITIRTVLSVPTNYRSEDHWELHLMDKTWRLYHDICHDDTSMSTRAHYNSAHTEDCIQALTFTLLTLLPSSTRYKGTRTAPCMGIQSFRWTYTHTLPSESWKLSLSHPFATNHLLQTREYHEQDGLDVGHLTEPV